MMKKLLLNLLLLLTMAIGAVAQETLTVYDGTTTNGYVPVYGYYADAYLKAEFVIPSADLAAMNGGTISEMKFYASQSSVSWGSANFQVFLKEVNETTISAYSGTEGATVVYEGALSIAGGEMVVPFANDYVYNGSNLLVGFYNTEEGSYVTSSWYGQSVDGASYQGYSYSSLEEVSGSQNNFIPKTTFTYIPAGGVSCARPSGLTVSNVDINSATLSWNAGADETAWQICINDVEENLIDVTGTTYNLTELTAATTYTVKVRANCGGSNGVSSWTGNVSFTTPHCAAANMCTINYELEDSYGDGWISDYSGNSAINVIDVATTEVLATLTMDNGSSLTGQLSLCNGQEIQFVWVSGDYDDECSYTITDVNGDEIFSGSDAMATVNYTVSCSSCRKPSGLQVSNITTTGANLVWTPGNTEEAWQICLNDDEEHLITADANGYTLTGLDELTEYTVKVRAYCSAEEQSAWLTTTFTTLSSCPAPEDVEVSDITSYTANISWTAEANADSYIVRYAALQTMFEEDFENGFPEGWSNIDADNDGNVWVSSSNPGIYHNEGVDLSGTGHNDSEAYVISGSFANQTGTALTPDNWLITPAIQLPSDVESLNLKFYASAQDVSYAAEHYGVYISTTVADDTDAFTLLWDEDMDADGGPHRGGTWGEKNTDLTAYAGQTVYIAIRHFNCTDMFILNIDDFSISYASAWTTLPANESPVELTGLTANTTYQYQVGSVCGSSDDNWSATGSFTTLVSCPAPTALTATNVTAHSATLSWNPSGSEDAWQISVGGDEENLILSESNAYDLANLEPETSYTVKVRAYCAADDQSAWTDEVTFTTLPTCVAPTSLTATNVTAHTATITWAAGADETAWQVMVNDNDTDIVDVEDTPTYEMTGLDGETPYSVKVRAYCDVDDQSAWVNVNFTTLVACPAPTALAASNVTANSATLTWTAGASETSWVLQYGTDNTFAVNTEITADAATVELTDLTGEVIYYARVKAVCGGVDGESAWSNVCTFNPSAAMTIGTADATSGYVPTYILYNYSLTQQIYTADEIGTAGDILSVAFYGQGSQARNLDVYMVATDKTNFESTTDWITVSESDRVFSGSVNFVANVWTTITLTTPFTYDGTSNLAIIVADNTGTWTSSIQFNVYNVESNQSIYKYRDSEAFDPANPSVEGNLMAKKNQIRLLIDGTPTYTITATAGENGSITPSGAVTVTEGSDKEFTIEANENYRILSVVVDDADVTAAVVENNGVYTFTNVTADHTIAATFVSETALTYTITATAGENGTISPSGAVSVEEGADQPFEITPNANYEIDVLTVDSNEIALTEDQREGFTYTFESVTSGHTINVTFRLATSVEINDAAAMAVYPNPNNGMFSIDFSNIEGEATYQLIDARGAVVETREINVTNGETKMFNHTLTAGTYFVRIIAGDKVYVEQIVVE